MNQLVPAIRVKNLSFYYNNCKIFEDISMDIYQNKVTAIIGSSGCGKSTFTQVLNVKKEVIKIAQNM
uniref:ATP-binding cassette domain-containing protein n=1 Tax=Umezakia ovalisporum TaxID=75695 RepID=UPI0039C714E4